MLPAVQTKGFRYHPALSITVISLFSILLAGCLNFQTSVAIYGDQQWSGVQAMQISAEFSEMMNQGDSQTTSEDGVTVTQSFETDGFDDWLQQAQEASEYSDANVVFDQTEGEDGSQNFILRAEGDGLESMNQVLFGGSATISSEMVGEQRHITIRYVVSDPEGSDASGETLSPQELKQQQEMMAAFGLGIGFRISGGEIISSNASRVEGGTAIWDFPDVIEVTLTEADSFSPETVSLMAPPSGSTFSPEALESMLAGISEGFETSAAGGDSSPGNSAGRPADSAESGSETAQAESTTADSSSTAGATDENSAAGTSAAENVTNTEGGETQSATTDQTSDSSGEDSAASDTIALDTEAADGGEASAETMDQTASDPASVGEESEGTVATPIDDTVVPAVEDSSLPQSGGILPTSGSAALAVLAGLILLTLSTRAVFSLVRSE